MVNRWNKAIAVKLWYNYNISFIATQCKTMAIVFYITNYVIKVENPVWKQVAVAAELFYNLDKSTTERQVETVEIIDSHKKGNNIQNKIQQFLMRVINWIFTERPLLQVEVIAYLLSYNMEFINNNI